MVYVLVAQEGGRTLRFSLAVGQHTVGSSAESALRLNHPTISRRHAGIEVSEAGVTIEDFGSRNGTVVEGERIRGRRQLLPGMEISFGSVVAALEVATARDLEAGILFEDVVSSPSARSEERSLDTAAVGSMRVFALDKLPELVDLLQENCTILRMAQAVGEALSSTLPCVRLEIASEVVENEERGILFSARNAPDPSDVHEARVVLGAIQLSAVFAHPTQASTYRPLLKAAVGLIGFARVAAEVGPSVARRPVRLPDPPTVDPAVRQIYEDARRVAVGTVGVLIRGESGTGKEILARYIHAASPRRDGGFVALNCAALPSDLLESELFGIESGVATGVDSRPGRFEQADGGTLFLDEIGDMAIETQAKILRVLQEGEVYRLGAREARPAQTRVLAATNRDLPQLIADGAFRSDLYHRIADWRVEIPPLRRRQGDIPNLAAYFLQGAAERQGVRITGISKAAIDGLLAYDWPGNIRQLEREMARAVLFLEPGELLRVEHLAPEVRDGRDEIPSGDLEEILRAATSRAVRKALAASQGNVAAAARSLGIGRSTLYRHMKEIGLSPEEV